MGFPERLSMSCVTDTLEHSDMKVMPVDLVAAMTGASRLGSDLFRAADADAEAFRRAILLLTRETINRLHIGRAQAWKLAFTAIQEVLLWQCHHCNGAGQVVAGNLKVVCPKCGGNGAHRWSDAQRAKLMGITIGTYPKWEKKYLQVLDMAAVAYSSIIGQAQKRLG